MNFLNLLLQAPETGPDNEKKLMERIRYLEDKLDGVTLNGQIRSKKNKLKSTLKKGGASLARKSFHTGSSFLGWIVRNSLFLLLIGYLFIWYGFEFFDTAKEFLLTIFETEFISNLISPLTQEWLVELIIFMFIISLIVAVFPTGERKFITPGKAKFFRFEIWLLVIILLGILTYTQLGPSYEGEENRDQLGIEVETRWQALVKRVTCAFNVDCALNENNNIEGQGTERIEYVMQVDKIENGQTFSSGYQFNTLPFSFSYTTEANDEIKIESHSCYHGKVSEENRFHHEDFSDKIVRGTDFRSIGQYFCENLNTIPLEDDNRQEVKIYSVLKYSVDTTINQKIPAISYESISEEGIPANEAIQSILKKGDDELIVPTGLFGKIETNLENQLPLIIGDDQSPPLVITLKIDQGTQKRFGKFLSGRITDISEPNVITIETPEDAYKQEIKFNDGLFGITLAASENDGVSLLNSVKTTQPLIFSLTTTFEKVDHSTVVIELTEEERLAIRNSEESEELFADNSQSPNNNNIVASNENTETNNDPTTLLGTPDEDGIYEYGADDDATNLYYRNENGWEWSPDKINWMSTNVFVVNGGRFENYSPTDKNIEFIKSLS